MKIVISETRMLVNEIALNSGLGGLLSGFALVSFIFLLNGSAEWLEGNADAPLVQLLSTALLGVLAGGRFSAAERAGDKAKSMIDKG